MAVDLAPNEVPPIADRVQRPANQPQVDRMIDAFAAVYAEIGSLSEEMQDV